MEVAMAMPEGPNVLTALLSLHSALLYPSTLIPDMVAKLRARTLLTLVSFHELRYLIDKSCQSGM